MLHTNITSFLFLFNLTLVRGKLKFIINILRMLRLSILYAYYKTTYMCVVLLLLLLLHLTQRVIISNPHTTHIIITKLPFLIPDQ
jgi:hypothetical protein